MKRLIEKLAESEIGVIITSSEETKNQDHAADLVFPNTYSDKTSYNFWYEDLGTEKRPPLGISHHTVTINRKMRLQPKLFNPTPLNIPHEILEDDADIIIINHTPQNKHRETPLTQAIKKHTSFAIIGGGMCPSDHHELIIAHSTANHDHHIILCDPNPDPPSTHQRHIAIGTIGSFINHEKFKELVKQIQAELHNINLSKIPASLVDFNYHSKIRLLPDEKPPRRRKREEKRFGKTFAKRAKQRHHHKGRNFS